MECIQNEKKVLNRDINKLNWRFNQIYLSDQKPGHLLYDTHHPSIIYVYIYIYIYICISNWFVYPK